MINLSKIKHIGIGVIIGSLLTASVSFSSNPIKLIINSKEIENAEAILIEGRTYVPLRVIANSLEASVMYDSESNTIYIKSKDQGITGAIGNGPKIDCPVPVDSVDSIKERVFPDIYSSLNNYEKENPKLDFINFENNSAYIFKQTNNQGLLIEFKNTKKEDIFVEIISEIID